MGITRWYGNRAFEEPVDPETIVADCAVIAEETKKWFAEMDDAKSKDQESLRPDPVSENQ